MKRAILSVILVAGVAQAAPSREVVSRLLGGYESRVGPDDVRRLGAGVDHVLVAIAVDPAERPLRRNRALAALAWVPSTEGRDLLRAVVRQNARATSGVAVLDLAVAARSLGAFGPEEDADLAPLLAHPVGDVRAAAADGLARARAVSALPSLRVRLLTEREPAVAQALVRAIAALATK